jgi:hypothetical protein
MQGAGISMFRAPCHRKEIFSSQVDLMSEHAFFTIYVARTTAI